MNLWQGIWAGCLVFIVFIVKNGYAAEPEFITTPKTNEGNKWHIGYYQGGDYNDYYNYLQSTIQGLMKLGWIKEVPIPQHVDKDTKALWDWLAHQTESAYLEFLDNGYYSANWDSNIRTQRRREIIARLNDQRDIDLMIAMGTWAGKDLANSKHDTPTLVMSSSDPIGAGIIESIEDSGYDHVFVHVDPYRFERQVRLFHDIVGFKKLGVAYEDTVAGRSYAAIDKVEKIASKRGFEVVHCHTLSDLSDQSLAERSVIQCFEELARQVDALYVTSQGGVSSNSIPELVNIANKYHVPTFSQLGSEEVKHGFLLSLSNLEYKSVGLFSADTMAKVMNGAKPRQLNQLFEDKQNISINLKTAELIGLYLHSDVLAAADKIYRQIEGSE